MNVCLIVLTLTTISSIASNSWAGGGDPVSVRPAKSEFGVGETVEVVVTNISADPVYLIPTFSSYPFGYFYPPDNYLEVFDGEYWRPLQRVQDITYYDKRLLFFELAPLDSRSLTCSLSDFDGSEEKNTGNGFRAVVNVIANPEAPIVSWQDFEEYGQQCQETIKSDTFTIVGEEENPDKE
ncbi:MAG: hypothetical protein JSW52_04500 [Candidatus Coatesbacteria bacterium]|nr:MAG: hypothetical protein JSW52_04500 [Candidatus Coatesbacteria bacterium]